MIALANILGLLGLLSIIALIIIYIIKPNFQQKVISSTFVWKLSLKYRRKRIPVNKLRNLLLILCQVLILTSCALILAKPILRADQPEMYPEKIIIVDASVGMMSEYQSNPNVKATTRFQRAIDQVKVLVNDVLSEEDGKVTIIFAGKEATMLDVEYMALDGMTQDISVMRLDSQYLDSINEKLELIATDLILDIGKVADYCTYGSGDIDGAMRLAESVLEINPDCEVLLYTGTEYTDSGFVNVIDVKEEGERNAAILGGSAFINERNAYTFKVDVAVYGADVLGVQVKFTVKGANVSLTNPSGVDLETYTMQVDCIDNQVTTVEFNTWNEFNDLDDPEADYHPGEGTVFNYTSVFVEIVVVEAGFYDVLKHDNTFYFYGGNPPTLNVQYVSSAPNIFITAATSTWQTQFEDRWNIVVRSVQPGEEPELEGYDIYIFEHEMPKDLPTDGVVILLDPDSFSSIVGVESLGVVEVETWESGMDMKVKDTKHPIMKHLVGEDMKVTKITPFNINGAGWQDLMHVYYTMDYAGEVDFPVCALYDEPSTKILLFSLNVNHSNFAVESYFPVFMSDMFNYFYPETMSDYLYEIGETATFNAFSNVMELYTQDATADHVTLTDFPASLELEYYGTYTLEQSLMSGRVVRTEFFVKIPSSESDVLRVEDELTNPYVSKDVEDKDIDLLIWFAAALVALLFAEWWLQSRDQF